MKSVPSIFRSGPRLGNWITYKKERRLLLHQEFVVLSRALAYAEFLRRIVEANHDPKDSLVPARRVHAEEENWSVGNIIWRW